MPDFAGVMKEEITRLARKECRAQLEPVLEKLTTLRRRIASQRQDLAELTRELSGIVKKLGIEEKDYVQPVAMEIAERSRIGKNTVAILRKKLGLSRRQLGLLVGVNANSIYLWENGKTSPRKAAKAKIVALKSVGKRALNKMLEEAEASAAS